MKSVRKLAARALRKGARMIDPPAETRAVEDEGVTWLSYAIPGMLDPGNIYLMDYAIRNLPGAGRILEIGSFCGLSTNVITHFKRLHGKRNPLITCDKWDFENTKGRRALPNSPVLFSDYAAFARETYIRNIKMFSADDLPFTISLSSDEFFAAWKEGKSATDVMGRPVKLGGPLSFCYIDGNHTYEFAKRDFLNCDQFLEQGGFILFDDSTLPEFGVARLMPEIIAGGRYKLIAANPNYLFQKT